MNLTKYNNWLHRDKNPENEIGFEQNIKYFIFTEIVETCTLIKGITPLIIINQLNKVIPLIDLEITSEKTNDDIIFNISGNSEMIYCCGQEYDDEITDIKSKIDVIISNTIHNYTE